VAGLGHPAGSSPKTLNVMLHLRPARRRARRRHFGAAAFLGDAPRCSDCRAKRAVGGTGLRFLVRFVRYGDGKLVVPENYSGSLKYQRWPSGSSTV
jgi:hypothetical protein